MPGQNYGTIFLNYKDGRQATMSPAEYEKNKHQIYQKDPLATASQISAYDPSDDDIKDDDKFIISSAEDSPFEVDAKKFRKNKDALYAANLKGLKVQKVRPMEYFAEQGEEQKAYINDKMSAIKAAEDEANERAFAAYKEQNAQPRNFGQRLMQAAATGGYANRGVGGFVDPTQYGGWLNTQGKEYNDELKNYQAARNLLHDAQNLQNSLTKEEARSEKGLSRVGMWGKGVAQGHANYVNDEENWNAVVGIENAGAMLNLQQKISDIVSKLPEDADGAAVEKAIRKGLNKSELALFDAVQASGAVSSALSDKIAGSVKAGETMAMSERMGLEFLLFNGIAGAGGRAVQRGVSKYLYKRLVKDGMSKLGRTVAKGAAKVIGADVGAIVGGAAQTALGPSNWSEIAKNTEAAVQAFMASPAVFMTPENRIKHGIRGPQQMGEILWDGTLNMLVENATEFGLGPFNKLLGGVSKAGYRGLRKLGWDKLATLLSPQASAFLKRAGVGSLAEETGEEINGAIIDYFRGNKDAIKDFADLENFGILMASFVPTIGLGAGVSAVQRGVYNNRYKAASDAYLTYLVNEKEMSTSEARAIVDSVNGSTPEELGHKAAILLGALDQSKNSQDKGTEAQLILDLLKTARDRNAANGVQQLVLEEDREKAREGIMDNTKGYQFWRTRPADMVDEGGTPYKGEEEYVDVLTTNGDNNFFIRKENEDGSVETIDENGNLRTFSADEVRQGLADGTFTARRSLSMDDFLDLRNGIKKDSVWQVSEERLSAVAAQRAGERAGENLTQNDAYSAQRTLTETAQALQDLGVDASILESTPEEIARMAFEERQAGNEELSAALSDYADAKGLEEGMYNSFMTRASQSSEAMADALIGQVGVDGNVITAEIVNGDVVEPVYVLSSDIVQARDGSITVIGGTPDSKVRVQNAQTGEERLVSVSELSAVGFTPVDEFRNGLIGYSMEAAEKEFTDASNTMSPEAKEQEVALVIGHTILVQDEAGNVSSVVVVNIDDEGQATIKDAAGKGQQLISPVALYDMAQKNADGSIALDPTAKDNQTAPETPVQQPTQQPAQPQTQAQAPQDMADLESLVNTDVNITRDGVQEEVFVTDVSNGQVEFITKDEEGNDKGVETMSADAFRAAMRGEVVPETQEEQATAETETAETEETPVEENPAEPVQQSALPMKNGEVDWDNMFNVDDQTFAARLPELVVLMQETYEGEAMAYAQSWYAAAKKKLEDAKKMTGDPKKDAANAKKRKEAQTLVANYSNLILAMSPQQQAPAAPATPATPETPAVEGETNAPDISDDTPEAAQARGYIMENGNRIDRAGEDAVVAEGNDTQISFAKTQVEDAKYGLAEAERVIPSHVHDQENPLHFFAKRWQPKDRKKKDSAVSIQQMANNIRPGEITRGDTAYNGAPIINARGEVIQGNGRSEALRRAYETGKAGAYKQWLADHASEFGLTAEQVNAMQNPVLVRVMNVDDAKAEQLGQRTQGDLESGGSGTFNGKEVANKLGNRMDEFISMLFGGDLGEDATLLDYVNANGQLVMDWLHANNFINDTEYGNATEKTSGGNVRYTDAAMSAFKDLVLSPLYNNAPEKVRQGFEKLPKNAKLAIQKGMALLTRPEGVIPDIQAALAYYYDFETADPAFASAKTAEDAMKAIEEWMRNLRIDSGKSEADLHPNIVARSFAAKFKGSRTIASLYDLIKGIARAMQGENGVFGTTEPVDRISAYEQTGVLTEEQANQLRNKKDDNTGGNDAGRGADGQSGQRGSQGVAASGQEVGAADAGDTGAAESGTGAVEGEGGEVTPAATSVFGEPKEIAGIEKDPAVAAAKAWAESLSDEEKEELAKIRSKSLREVNSLIKDNTARLAVLKRRGATAENTPYMGRLERLVNLLENYKKSGEMEARMAAYGVEANKPISVEKIRDIFYHFNEDPELAALFDRVAEAARRLGLKITFTNKLGSRTAGQYTLSDNTVEYKASLLATEGRYDAEKVSSTILHELIHSVTSYALYLAEYAKNVKNATKNYTPKTKQNIINAAENASPELLSAATALYDVFEQVKRAGLKDKYGQKSYGTKDAHELVAELSNPEFREQLKKVNLWSKVVDAIKRLLNAIFPSNNVTALEATERALERLLDTFDIDTYNDVRTVQRRGDVKSRQKPTADQAAPEVRKKRSGEPNFDYVTYLYDEYDRKANEIVPAYVMENPDMASVKEVFEIEDDEEARGLLEALRNYSTHSTVTSVFVGGKYGKIIIFGSHPTDEKTFDKDMVHESIHAIDSAEGWKIGEKVGRALVDAAKAGEERLQEIYRNLQASYDERQWPREMLSFALSDAIVNKGDVEEIVRIAGKENEKAIRDIVNRIDYDAQRVHRNTGGQVSGSSMEGDSQESTGRGSGTFPHRVYGIRNRRGAQDETGRPNLPRVRRQRNEDYSEAVKSGDLVKAQELVDEAADAAGYTIRGDHGTTNKFTIFSKDKANPEGDWGQGFYFSNNEDDVEANYANNEGPDLTGRIEHLADQMEWMDGYENMSYEERLEAARKRLSEGEPRVIRAAIKMDNPLVVGGENETFFDYNENYNEETDEWGAPEGMLTEFIEAFMDECWDRGIDPTKVDLSGIYEEAYGNEGISASDLDKLMRSRLGLEDFSDDEGNVIVNEILRATYERMGFDGIVDNTVNKKFGSERRLGQPMKGMDEDTVHYIAFQPNQIKQADAVTYDDNGNVIPLSERFDELEDDIRYKRDNENQEIFVSNAERAVESIQNEKATPQQWLAQLEKNGGIKAGEDKWLGLSDWLKASDKKTITKQEILDFIDQNKIRIEEVHYSTNDSEFQAALEVYQKEMDSYKANPRAVWDEADKDLKEFYDTMRSKYGDGYLEEMTDAELRMEDNLIRRREEADNMDSNEVAYEMMVDKYGEDFKDAFSLGKHGVLVVETDYYDTYSPQAMYFLSQVGAPDRMVNEERLRYTTEGVENKREIALTVPTIEPWKEGDAIHFGDAGEGRAIAWVRYGDTIFHPNVKEWVKAGVWARMNEAERKEHPEMRPEDPGATGQVLVIDEIQSKRHQEGREKGYKEADTAEKLKDAASKFHDIRVAIGDKYGVERGSLSFDELNPEINATEEERKEYNEIASEYKRLSEKAHNDALGKSVPAAPFEKNWHELAMKRMLRLAAEEGYDYIAWTTGEQQAERYNIGDAVAGIDWMVDPFNKEAKDIHVDLQNDASYSCAIDSEGNIIAEEPGVSRVSGMVGKNISELVGKEMAEKMLAEEEGKLTGEGLRIGGEGMKAFYDKMLTAFVNKYVKKWGVKVEDINLPDLGEGETGLTMHSVKVTPEMKESVMEGQLMFREAPSVENVENNANFVNDDRIRSIQRENGEPAQGELGEVRRDVAGEGREGVGRQAAATSSETSSRNLQLLNEGLAAERAKYLERRDSASRAESDGSNRDAGRDASREDVEFGASEALIELARENGLYLTPSEIKGKFGREWDNQGFESLTLISADGKTFTKVKNPFAISSKFRGPHTPYDVVAEVIAHNAIFPDTEYRLVGITSIGGMARLILQQDAVEGRGRLMDRQKAPYLAAKGLAYSRWQDAGEAPGVTIWDIDFNNTFVDQNGSLRTIDPVIRFTENPQKVIEGLSPYGVGVSYDDLRAIGTAHPLAAMYVNAYERYLRRSELKEEGAKEEMLGALQAIYKRTEGYPADSFNGDMRNEIERMQEKYASWSEAVDTSSAFKDSLEGLYYTSCGFIDRPDVRDVRSEAEEQARLAEIERLSTEATLDRMSEELGIKINRVSRDGMPKGHKTDKGYYDTATGEMTICMDNVTDERDAIATVLHETVGHHGLRKLFGANFRDAMRDIYARLDEKGRTWVNSYIVNHGLDFGDEGIIRGMEEYLAHLAESGDFKNSVWNDIKEILSRIVDFIFGTEGFTFTDNELNYILRASYEHLKDPNWLNTVEGKAKDTLMKRALGINETDPNKPTDPQGPDAGRLYRDGDSGNARDDYEAALKEGENKMIFQHQNADLPVKLGMEKIMKEKGITSYNENEDYLTRHVLASSRAETQFKEFERKYFVPILDQMRAVRDKLLAKKGDLGQDNESRIEAYERTLDYLYAVSGLERTNFKNGEIEDLKQQAVVSAMAAADAKREEVRSSGKSRAEIDRAIEAIDKRLDAQVRKIESDYEKMKKDWSGLTSLTGESDWREAIKKTEQLIDDFKAEVGDEAMLDELWNRIRNATDYNLDHAYRYGLLTREEYERLHGTASQPRMWNYYLPLRGFNEKTAEQEYNYSTLVHPSSNSVVVKKMNGRWTKADNPLANILNIAQTEIVQGNENWARQALYRFALKAGENSLLTPRDAWYVKDETTGEWALAAPEDGESFEEFEAKMEKKRAGIKEDGTVGEPTAKMGRRGLKLDKIMANKAHRNEHLIRLKVGGMDKTIWVNGDPTLAKSVMGLERKMEWGAIRRASRALSNLFTTYSLDFTARNLIRDTIYSRLALMVKEDNAYRQQFRKNWRRNFGYGAFAYPMVKLMAEYESGRLQDKPVKTKKEQMFLDFMADGGQTGYTIINSVDKIKKSIERSMARGADKTGKISIPILGHLAEGIKILNEGFELLTRFTAYETSRDMGRSGQRSALDAKEISVNFNRRGAQTGEGFWGVTAAYLGATHYFYNAGVQGFDNFLRLFKVNPKTMGVSTGALIALATVQPLLNSALAGLAAGLGGGGDDDWYWNLPEWVRRNNIIIGTGQYYLAIPLAVELRAFWGLGDIISTQMYHKEAVRNGFEVGADVINTAAEIIPFNPVEGYAASKNFGEAIIRAAVPDAAIFLVDVATNRDYTGRPLWKENPFSNTVPKAQSAYASTPRALTEACKWLAEHTNGGVDIAPGLARDFLKNYGGGFYRLAEDATKLLSANDEYPRRWDDIPFFSGFTGHLDEDRSNSFAKNALYDYSKNADDVVRRLNATANTNDITAKMAYEEPEKLPQSARVQTILEGEKYLLGKMYYEGKKNTYKMKRRKNNTKYGKKGEWYESREIEKPGVETLEKNWKEIRAQWWAMPDKTQEEKDAKKAFQTKVEDAWHKYYDAEANLVDKLMEEEYYHVQERIKNGIPYEPKPSTSEGVYNAIKEKVENR